MKFRLLVSITSLALSSCAMRLSNTRSEANISVRASRAPWSATKEQRVFARIPNNSLSSGDFRITGITRLREGGGCGNSQLRTIFSAGLLPSTVPVFYLAQVSGYENGHAQTREYFLAVSGTYSLWQSMVPASHDDKVLARALIGAMSDGSRGPYPIKHPNTPE